MVYHNTATSVYTQWSKKGFVV